MKTRFRAASQAQHEVAMQLIDRSRRDLAKILNIELVETDSLGYLIHLIDTLVQGQELAVKIRDNDCVLLRWQRKAWREIAQLAWSNNQNLRAEVAELRATIEDWQDRARKIIDADKAPGIKTSVEDYANSPVLGPEADALLKDQADGLLAQVQAAQQSDATDQPHPSDCGKWCGICHPEPEVEPPCKYDDPRCDGSICNPEATP